MKRTVLFITCLLASLAMSAQEYYPEGTKWTEIRLDTLKYDSWYSKVGDEWVPNFETIEYYVKGEYTDRDWIYKKVYTNGPDWTDSLTFFLLEGNEEFGYNNIMVSVFAPDYLGSSNYVLWPGEAYQFDWSVGKGLYFADILMSNTTRIGRPLAYYGIINEIKEGYFGGVRPLRYVDLDGKAPDPDPDYPIRYGDTKGGRIIQGIGITEWDDGECLFGPPNPYFAKVGEYNGRHYRSMLVHFERNGEVLYNVWPEQTSGDMSYRPFVEDGKVWKVGSTLNRDNLVKMVEYYYFDGDTIIDGKTCKQMMRQRFVNPEYPDYSAVMQFPLLSYVGAWYEEDKKVYLYNASSKLFTLKYDFSVDANDTLQIDLFSYVVGPRQTGGIKGFKGVYREVRECGDEGITYWCAPWLEGVGIVYGPPTLNVLNVELADPMWFLMSCTVGDEIIYLNDACEDGATPEGARKRFDFTHTVKTKPQARTRSEEGLSLYGEYNDVQLGINLDPLDDAYQVRITDETGKAVYEKAVNAGNIVGLNIDISSYAKGRYTVTVENSQETFTGEFDAQATGIAEVRSITKEASGPIYNLQGQRLSTLQKGLNIVNGQKVYVK
jgi:hypothetical protein